MSCDGSRVAIDWGWQAPEAKRKLGHKELSLTALDGVDWRPMVGLNDGLLRFRVRGLDTALPPEADPHCVRLLWGTENELLTVLVAAAVVARLPHPNAPAVSEPDERDRPQPDASSLEEVDGVLRRLRELGDLHRDGILDDDEFAAAKQALLRRLSG